MLTEPKPRLEPDDRAFRAAALQRLEKVRKFKLNVAAYVVGNLMLGAVWAITEYQNSGGWPKRLSEHSNPGDWNPWILWVLLIWGFFLALDALKLFFRRPSTEAEVQREIEKLKAAR